MQPVHISSISWIDDKSVPKVGFWFVAGALTSWPKRVIMGLVGTSNPEPPVKVANIAAFATGKQYRAMLAATVHFQPTTRATDVLIDAGYTPPFDKSKLDTRLRDVAPIPDDPKFHPGESSPLSGVTIGKLHECSTLTVPRSCEVVASAFIKFRAGEPTDKIGVQEANSPVHVPWVWCEYALVCASAGYRLLCNGSTFPSHAWYVNGHQVAKRLQDAITVSDHDPALSTGQPAAHPRTTADADKSIGTVTAHQYALQAGKPIDIALPSLRK